ncbi:MAG TPA: hypothetical protein VNP98_04220 [Chthoniobacterales bacterium]|nr:hypothetical protein [Chthoniobacterales bacterium]
MSIRLYVFIFALALCNRVDGAARQNSVLKPFRQPYDLSVPERDRLVDRALTGNATAALTLYDYYTFIEKQPHLREKFLRIGVQAGSKIAYDALIAFYVKPGGIFRPYEALTLRRERNRHFASKPLVPESVWAYEASKEFRYSNSRKDFGRRKDLLRLAESLGSQAAKTE